MADLIGADPMTDLAVLKLRLDEREQKKEKLFVAKFGNSDEVEVEIFATLWVAPLDSLSL